MCIQVSKSAPFFSTLLSFSDLVEQQCIVIFIRKNSIRSYVLIDLKNALVHFLVCIWSSEDSFWLELPLWLGLLLKRDCSKATRIWDGGLQTLNIGDWLDESQIGKDSQVRYMYIIIVYCNVVIGLHVAYVSCELHGPAWTRQSGKLVTCAQ